MNDNAHLTPMLLAVIFLLTFVFAHLIITHREKRHQVRFTANREAKPGEATGYLVVTLWRGRTRVPLLFTESEFERAKERARKQPEEFND